MKILLSLLLLGSIASPAAIDQIASTTSTKVPFSISICARHTEIRAGTPVEIRIRFTNTSDHEISASQFYVDGGLNSGYDYYVLDANGKSAKKKEIVMAGSLDLASLNPGESRDDGSLVSRAYDMTRPGKYVIQVSRRVSSNPKDGVVKSNKIVVTLTP